MTQKAFTLIELLIVVAIIGVLTGLVIIVINPEQLRREARDVNRRKDLALISTALEQYYADNNAYPDSATVATLECLESYLEGGDVDTDCDGTDDLSSQPVYLNNMPTSQSSTAYEYCYSTNGGTQNYVVCAPIEANPDEEPDISGTVPKCPPSAPAGVIDFGTYCIENPF